MSSPLDFRSPGSNTTSGVPRHSEQPGSLTSSGVDAFPPSPLYELPPFTEKTFENTLSQNDQEDSLKGSKASKLLGSSGTFEIAKTTCGPTSRLSQVDSVMQNGKSSKSRGLAFLGSTIMVLGGIPKTILNLPILKQLSKTSGLIGATIGGIVGGIIGGLLFHPKKGASLGQNMGYALLDPRTLFNGICKAGDSLLRSGGVSIVLRTRIDEITRVPIINRSVHRNYFIKKQYIDFLTDVVKSHNSKVIKEQKLSDIQIRDCVYSWMFLTEYPDHFDEVGTITNEKQTVDLILAEVDKDKLRKKTSQFDIDIQELNNQDGVGLDNGKAIVFSVDPFKKWNEAFKGFLN